MDPAGPVLLISYPGSSLRFQCQREVKKHKEKSETNILDKCLTQIYVFKVLKLAMLLPFQELAGPLKCEILYSVFCEEKFGIWSCGS